jgi:uncharacterized protein
MAELARPRVWPTFAVLGCALPVLALVAGVVFLIVITVTSGAESLNPEGIERWIDEHGASVGGLLAMIVPGQLVVLSIAFGAALVSPQPLVRRLDLTPPRIGVMTWISILAGTLGVRALVAVGFELLVREPNQAMLRLSKLFWDVSFVPGLLVLCFLPGFAEELLCRGYAQSRLVARFGAARGMLAPTLVFALMHFDVQHSLAILPLGFWFAYVAWRAGSVWVSVAAHAWNNAYVLISLRLWGDRDAPLTVAPSDVSFLPLLLLPLTALAVIALERSARATPQGQPVPLPST